MSSRSGGLHYQRLFSPVRGPFAFCPRIWTLAATGNSLLQEPFEHAQSFHRSCRRGPRSKFGSVPRSPPVLSSPSETFVTAFVPEKFGSGGTWASRGGRWRSARCDGVALRSSVGSSGSHGTSTCLTSHEKSIKMEKENWYEEDCCLTIISDLDFRYQG